MANKSITILFLLFSALCVNAQTGSKAPADYRNNRAVEGGYVKVPIDTNTPLPELINRLNTHWKLEMTGKAYWIGYTDDMFSIANHGNEAIPLLVTFIDTTHNVKAKEGALYTLHLIGINSTIKGRFLETFENKNARKALLKYIGDNELNTTVIYLLMRDPWLSDVPQLMAYLEQPNRDYSKTLTALRRYNIDAPPLNQTISGTTFQKKVRIRADDYGIKPLHALVTFQKKFGKKFIIDNEITNSSEWSKSKEELASAKHSIKSTSVKDYFMSHGIFSYSLFSNLHDYTFDGDRVTVYGPSKARDIWLNWWQAMQPDKKERAFYK